MSLVGIQSVAAVSLVITDGLEHTGLMLTL